MDIQKLQALAVIQEAGSFSRAAETLGYSQAGLTYMMNSLENEVGLRLLDRSYSGVRLSETGKALMPKIHRLLQVYDSLNGEIRACRSPPCGWRRWTPSPPAGCPAPWHS